MAKSGKSTKAATTTSSPPPTPSPAVKPKVKKRLEIEGYPVEGISISRQETCVIFPTLSLAFDIGRCPQRAMSQDFLFISHAHLDHIGGLPMYVATRGLYRLRPPTIFVPKYLKELVEDPAAPSYLRDRDDDHSSLKILLLLLACDLHHHSDMLRHQPADQHTQLGGPRDAGHHPNTRKEHGCVGDNIWDPTAARSAKDHRHRS